MHTASVRSLFRRRAVPLMAAVAAILSALGPIARAEAALDLTLVATPYYADGSVNPYQSVSLWKYFDPLLTSWITWADSFSPSTNPSYPCSSLSGLCVGAHGFGTNDYIRLKVTNPSSVFLELDIDQNDGSGDSFGPQMVIYGTAASAPDVRRYDFPSGPYYFINESGAFNSIFTSAGTYTFDFSFRNAFGLGAYQAGHEYAYLLADVNPSSGVPEPGSLLLLGAGLAGLAGLAWRRHSTTSTPTG